MSVLEFHGVTLALGRRDVLSGVDLAIHAGEFIGVLGANGAGKTTLMRAALGLLAPGAGSIRVLGERPRRGNPLIGYVPQHPSLPASLRLSGFDVIAGLVAGHRLGVPWLSRAGRAEVWWALEKVGAADLAHRPLAALSGGERQRLLLAQALIGRPRLLLLDEPLISLDPRHQQGMVDLVRALQKELGFTALFSAHEINPLLGALDRVLYLGGGKAALGPVAEVISGDVLSRLYSTPIEVVRLRDRIFVLAGNTDLESQPHRHDPPAEHADAGL